MEIAANNFLPGGTSYLRSLDGRIKTCVLLAAVVVVSVLIGWPLAAGALFTALGLMFTLRLPLKKVLLRMCVPFGVGWLVLVSLAFSTGHTVVATIGFCGFSLPLYLEGISLGFLIMLRILAAVSLAMLLSFSTPMIEILATLRLMRVPALILDLAEMIYRYALSLGEVGATMRKAQRARGGEGLPWHLQARDVGIVAGNLLVKSFDRSVRVYKAMLARGYDEEAMAQPYFNGPIPAKDIFCGVMAGVILAALLVTNFALAWKGWSLHWVL
ncbi:MAG: cobalt ECF transporter T component CbiQ [Syntrophobacteraceae bacterium]|nr:cobalt ECF transporter T component CbiQ [Syntrophobacteraceae bacterium]